MKGNCKNVNTYADHPTGWVQPQRSLTLQELKVLIAEKKEELRSLEQQVNTLLEEAKLEAFVKIRNIMRAHGLSEDDLVNFLPSPRRRGKATQISKGEQTSHGYPAKGF